MKEGKAQLIDRIEEARKKKNDSIEAKESYGTILQNSKDLDKLIEQYIVEGYDD